jgi:hypothetical protein
VTAPFFVVGFQRSGTTLLRVMLDNHPDVAVPLDTTGLWSRMEAQLDHYGDLDGTDGASRLVRDLLAEERIRLWEVPLTVETVLAERRSQGYPGIVDAFYVAYARHKGKQTWGDKDPGNMLRIPTLLRWFPNARFVHIIRDGRDACLSQIKQEFGFDDCLPCAEAWREQVWWVRNMGKILGPKRYFELRYEDLTEDPERWLRQICDFLGLAYSSAMLDYHKRVELSIPESKRHLWPMLAEPPRTENSFRWKSEMSDGLRIAFEKRAGKVLQDLRYETLPSPPVGGYGAELSSVARQVWRGFRRRITGR